MAIVANQGWLKDRWFY